ncbi:MAG: response regulator [Magnetococcales bacterium]|nr:response regulator [Magnetococcales bacterium]
MVVPHNQSPVDPPATRTRNGYFKLRWSPLLPWLLLLLGVVWSIYAWRQELAHTQTLGDLRLHRLKEKVHGLTEQRLATHLNVLRSARGVFRIAERPGAEAWGRYVAALDLDDHYPGIEWLAFLTPIPAKAGEDGRSQRTGLRVTYVAPHGLTALKEGSDLGNLEILHRAALRARDHDTPIFTPVGTLPTLDGDVAGAWHLIPVYREQAPLYSQEMRRDALLGWVVAAYRVQELLLSVFQEVRNEVRVRIFETTSTRERPERLIFDTLLGGMRGVLPRAESASPVPPTERRRVTIHGVVWSYEILPTRFFREAYLQNTSYYSLAVGLVASLSLALLLWSFGMAGERARREAKRLSRAHRESEERLQRAVLGAPNPIMIHAEDGETILVNWLWQELSGCAKATCDHREQWLECVVAPEDQAHARYLLSPSVDENAMPREGELRIRNIDDAPQKRHGEDDTARLESEEQEGVDDQPVWFIRSRPLGRLADGRGMIISMAVDVTSRKQTEEQLRESTRRYRYVFQNVAVAMWDEDFTYVRRALRRLRRSGVRDLGTYLRAHPAETRALIDGIRVNDVNRAALDMHPNKSLEEITSAFGELFNHRTVEIFIEEMVAIWEGRSLFRGEVTRTFDNGESRTFLLSLPVPESREEFRHVPVSLQDVTELKRAHAVQQEAREAAERANHAKSAFLAAMSHEIRTPMNAIVGMAEVLSETELSSDQNEYVQIFRRAGENLLALINDILDLSKVEAGHMELDAISFPLREEMERLAAMLDVRVREKGLALTLEIDDAAPRLLVGDPVRVRQILINLVGNGVKFTKRGGVTVRVRPVGEIDEKGVQRLRFEVEDTGIGIPADRQEAIFDPFTQADGGIVRQYGGTGLGLAICQRLVTTMQGRIGVESRVGQGSLFWFEIPLEVPPEEEQESGLTVVSLKDMRALVLDEQADSRLLMARLLEGLGMQTVQVPHGQEAERCWLEAADGQPFRVVVMAGPASERSALVIVEALRSSLEEPTLPVVAVTTDLKPGELERARIMGVRLLVNPVSRFDLKNALESVLASPVAPEERADPDSVSADDSGGKRLLLVEDASDNVALICAFLKRTKHTIDVAENGAQALQKVQESGGDYDLVLMDMQMPVMDGLEATKAIRAWEVESGRPRLPVVALTAHAFETDLEKSRLAGCDYHVTKPVRKKVLLETIDTFARPSRS